MKFALPDWIPPDAWAGFLEMRAKIKKPMTDRAKQLAVMKLERLREAGQNIGAVLDQSTFHDWQGLYAVKVEDLGAATRERCGHISPAPENLRCTKPATEYISGVGWRCDHCKSKLSVAAFRSASGPKPVGKIVDKRNH